MDIITSKKVNSCSIGQLNGWKRQPLECWLESVLRRRTKLKSVPKQP